MTARRRGHVSVIVLLTTLAALLPAMLNGGPFFHPDTPSYLRAAAAGTFKIFGVHSDWTSEYLRVYAGSPAPGPIASPVAAQLEPPVTLSGRSIYYGILALATEAAGTFWLLIILQSLLAATSIYMTVSLIGRAAGAEIPNRHFLAIGLVTALASPLGFTSSYVMPGIFSGLGLLAEANLLFLWRWQSRWERVFWAALLAYSLLAHLTNMVLSLAILILGLGYLLWRKVSFTRWQPASVAAGILVGALGQMAFVYAVTASTGAPPVRPPFLAMRLIADGSGYEHLREHCVQERYFYCRALGHPNPHSDILLWSDDPRMALFRGLPEREERRSAAEQSRFVAAVVTDRPLQVIGEAARNSVGQLFSFDLNEFNYTAGNRDRFDATIPPELLRSMKETRAYSNRMPVGFFEAASLALTVASLIVLIYFLSRKEASSNRRALCGYCLCILAGIVTNAVVCGALSGPKGRYQMRLIWVMPVVAGAIASSRRLQTSSRMPSITT